MINLLLKNGADPAIVDSDGMVPLHKASVNPAHWGLMNFGKLCEKPVKTKMIEKLRMHKVYITNKARPRSDKGYVKCPVGAFCNSFDLRQTAVTFVEHLMICK